MVKDVASGILRTTTDEQFSVSRVLKKKVWWEREFVLSKCSGPRRKRRSESFSRVHCGNNFGQFWARDHWQATTQSLRWWLSEWTRWSDIAGRPRCVFCMHTLYYIRVVRGATCWPLLTPRGFDSLSYTPLSVGWCVVVCLLFCGVFYVHRLYHAQCYVWRAYICTPPNKFCHYEM